MTGYYAHDSWCNTNHQAGPRKCPPARRPSPRLPDPGIRNRDRNGCFSLWFALMLVLALAIITIDAWAVIALVSWVTTK